MIKNVKRKAITIYDEDIALTIMTPLSQEYQNMVIITHENAYGEISSELKRIADLKNSLSISTEEFDEILSQLS